MKLLKRTLAAAGAALTICGTAHAGLNDPGVTAKIEFVNSPVTYRRPGAKAGDPALVTFAAYKVTIFNNTTNDLNRLFIQNVVASNAPGTDPVIWDSVAPPTNATCTGFGTSTLSCETTLSVPTKPGGNSTSFIIVARAPKDGPNITVNGFAGGREGNGAGNGCCAVPFDTPAVTALTDSTDNTQNSNVRSYIKRNGTTTGSSQLFTGDRYITTPNDRSTTFVDVPAFDTITGVNFALGSIAEELLDPTTDLDCLTGNRLLKCPKTAIDIFKNDSTTDHLNLLGTGNYLSITLRLDASAVKPGTKISDILVSYTPDPDDTGPGASVPGPLALCVNSPGVFPCIVDRNIYTGSAGKDLKGDYYWIIRHFRNGGYRVF